jgi:ABC-type Zn uptake system ZnuABC Zn-binding protein ZnuA
MYRKLYALAYCFFVLMAPKQAISSEIAVTLPPLAGLVTMLDEKIEVLCLLPGGADPHHFQLSPRKIEALKRTRLLIRASFDDGGWPLPPSHAHTLDLWPGIDHGWLSPEAVRKALPLVAEALVKLHPEKANAIAASLKDALQQTHKIEQAWRTALEPVKISGVMMQHPAWLRLMNEMNIPVLAVLESGRHGHQYGPHPLEDALKNLIKHPDAWLVADIGHNRHALDWLALHVDSTPHRIALDALGKCGMSWDKLMLANLGTVNTNYDRSAAPPN